MYSKLIVALIVLTFLSCFSTNSLYTAEKLAQYEDEWSEFLGAGEQVERNWYHFMTSKNYKGQIVYRQFHPEKRQITKMETFNDKELTVRDGEARYWYDNGSKNSEGKYRYDKKIGEWKYYRWPEGTLSRQGRYSAGVQSGKWRYYDEDGNFVKTLDLSSQAESDSLNYDELSNTFTFLNADGYDEMIVAIDPVLEQCAELETQDQRSACTKSKLLKYIYGNLNYPENARALDVEGKVVLTFIINKSGEIESKEFIMGVCQDFEEAALNIVNTMPAWIPGSQHGEKVKVRYKLPIKFKLE